MSPKRLFENEAGRQAAYRQRKQERQERLLQAIVIAPNERVDIAQRLAAIRDIWLIARQPPQAAPEAIATVIGHANVVLTELATSVTIPEEWRGEFNAIFAQTTGWLLEFKATHGREDSLFLAMETTYEEAFGNQPLDLLTGAIHPDVKRERKV